jgi:Gas vesicle protein
MGNDIEFGRPRASGLVEVLDRVLDKGLFIGGDIKISLAEVELLTIRIRLIVCSLDKARDIGLDWWTYDRHLAPGKVAAAEREALEERIRVLERRLAVLTAPKDAAAEVPKPPRAARPAPARNSRRSPK